MRALSLTQPWAQLMADGRKVYETRSWKAPATLKPGDVFAIASSRGWAGVDKDCAEAYGYAPGMLWRGFILAVVNFGECERVEAVRDEISKEEFCAGNYDDGRYAWRTFGVHKLARPVPCKGALGLWTMPADVFDAVMGQL